MEILLYKFLVFYPYPLISWMRRGSDYFLPLIGQVRLAYRTLYVALCFIVPCCLFLLCIFNCNSLTDKTLVLCYRLVWHAVSMHSLYIRTSRLISEVAGWCQALQIQNLDHTTWAWNWYVAYLVKMSSFQTDVFESHLKHFAHIDRYQTFRYNISKSSNDLNTDLLLLYMFICWTLYYEQHGYPIVMKVEI